jgi:hypothetical protein
MMMSEDECQHFDIEHSAFGGPAGLDVVGNKPNGQIIERIVACVPLSFK